VCSFALEDFVYFVLKRVYGCVCACDVFG